MKRPGLSTPLASATLFLIAAATAQLCAQDMKPEPPAGKARQAGEILKRYDRNGDGRLDDDERAEAKEQLLQEQVQRQMARAAALPGGLEQFRVDALRMFDRNRDGQLDEAERVAAQAFATRLAEANADREELRNQFDRNGDGTIDADEQQKIDSFMAALRTFGSSQVRLELIRRFDANADGKIAEDELAELEKVVRPRIEASREQMRRHDKNGDGQLDAAEWQVARRTLAAWLNGTGDATMLIPPGPREPAYQRSPEAERKRLQAVAAEVARRRAIREAAAKAEASSKAPAVP